MAALAPGCKLPYLRGEVLRHGLVAREHLCEIGLQDGPDRRATEHLFVERVEVAPLDRDDGGRNVEAKQRVGGAPGCSGGTTQAPGAPSRSFNHSLDLAAFSLLPPTLLEFTRQRRHQAEHPSL